MSHGATFILAAASRKCMSRTDQELLKGAEFCDTKV